jgi:hypothetical protein
MSGIKKKTMFKIWLNAMSYCPLCPRAARYSRPGVAVGIGDGI